MQKIIIDTEELTLDVFNFVVTDTELIAGVYINEEHPLAKWLKLSKAYSYTLRVTNKHIVNIHIPLNDITSIQYEQN